MASNARVKADAVNNSLSIKSFYLSIGIQLIEITNAQC